MYYSQLHQYDHITLSAGEVVDGTVGTEIVKLKPRLVEAAALFQSDIDDGSPGVRSSVVPGMLGLCSPQPSAILC